MKRLLSVFLLLILLAPSMCKLGVEVYYVLNKEYIAANLCVNKDKPITMCYGRCFVDAKFELIDQTPVQASSLSQVTVAMSDFLISDCFLKRATPAQPPIFSPAKDSSLTDGHLLSVFRPPLA